MDNMLRQMDAKRNEPMQAIDLSQLH